MRCLLKYIYITISLFMFFSCESMEDTYSEWQGDGIIRYVGKCYNIEVSPGWQRFFITWKNSTDKTIRNIKVTWETNQKKDSVILDAGITQYETPQNLINSFYEIKVYSIDGEGNHSIVDAAEYAKPFTNEHELLVGYSKVERKFYYLKNNLILFFNKVEDLIMEDGYYPVLTYVDIDGNDQELRLNSDIVNSKYLVIDNIASNSVAKITRSAKIDQCYDQINFLPYELERNKINFSGDFANQLKYVYNLNEDEIASFDKINEFTEFSLDFDIESLSDILYFQNLEVLKLGANRYFNEAYLDQSLNILENRSESLFALEIAKQILGFDIEIYNNHYDLLSNISSMDMGNPQLPTLSYLPMDGWEITTNTEEDGFYSHPEYMIDNDPVTFWKPAEKESDVRIHDIIIDMQNIHMISGFILTNPSQLSDSELNYLPKSFEILVSEDNYVWENPLYYSGIKIGNAKGETKLVEFPNEISARYIKISVKDIYGFRNYTYMGDLEVF